PAIIAPARTRTRWSDPVERRDVGQVAVEAVVVEAVPDHEDVRDREPDVVEGDLRLATTGLVEKDARAQALRTARLERTFQRGQGEAGVDDVVDDEHVAARDVDAEVGDDPHRARGAGSRPVARRAEKIDGEIDRQPAHEVGDERHRALENADQHGIRPGVVAGDRAAARRVRRASAGSLALYAPTWTVNADWLGVGPGTSVATTRSAFGHASGRSLFSPRAGFDGLAGGGAVRGAVKSW